MAITREQFKGIVAALFSAKDATSVGNAYDEFIRDKVSCFISDAATAGTAVTETAIDQVVPGGNVVGIAVMVPIAVTASDSNYATFTIAKRTGAGGATTIGSQTTKITGGSGNLAAFVPLVIPITAGTNILAAGDVLTIAVSKTGTGVALNAATSYVTVKVLYEKGV